MRILLSLLIISLLTQIKAQTLVVNISNIRNNEGQFQVALFENNDQMKNEQPKAKYYFEKKGIRNGKLTLRIPLTPGTYGITVLDDEDKSEKMTFQMGLYPKEGVGFSNYQLKGMSKPKFEEFSFLIEDKKETSVDVIIKYF